MNRIFLFLLFTLVLIGFGSCTEENKSSSGSVNTKVYKSDESIACESEGISLGEMAQELTNFNITVFCSQKGNDGLVRTAVCGISTGDLNIYTIAADDISTANGLGFRSTNELSEYVDQPCD